MSDAVIEFNHVFKKFARGEQHTSLRDFIPALARRLFRLNREEPELTGGEFWAVKDVSFQLKRGESMGIIGRNGSGKSTTLKMLSGILRPDRGTYNVRGRLSALIEVGAGFHPDLTGRENVYLNGSILGMTRKEVAAKFNDIVEFAGVEDFIDTPVKRYSSGMAVRLGFAVSAFIDPDVMLVDEVLAVGDTEFRNRCLNRMNRMLRNGTTMILVSHNLSEVRNLCQTTLLLDKGTPLMLDETTKVIDSYHRMVGEKMKEEQRGELAADQAAKAGQEVLISRCDLIDARGNVSEIFATGESMKVRIHYEAKRRVEQPQVVAELVWATDDYHASTCSTALQKVKLQPIEGSGYIDLNVDTLLMVPHYYAWNIRLIDGATGHQLDLLPKVGFVLNEQVPVPGVFALSYEWEQPSGKSSIRPVAAKAEQAA